MTYTPTGVAGPDFFQFNVFDGQVLSASVTVTVNVTGDGGDNTPPFANSQNLFTPENTAKSITLTGSDVDNDSLTFFINTLPTFGTLNGVPPTLTYTPPTGFNGTDSFTYRAHDGQASSLLPGTVTITVGTGGGPGNQAPIAAGQTVSTTVNQPITLVLTGSDPDGNALSFSIFTQPTRGSLGTLTLLSTSSASVTYTPFTGLSGQDALQFTVNDGQFSSGPATVIVNVAGGGGGNQPIVQNLNVTTPVNTALSITLIGNDPNGDPLSFFIASNPANGFITGTPPNVLYTPSFGFTGQDSFSYRASDGVLFSNTAVVGINVLPEAPPPDDNSPPTAESQIVFTTSTRDTGIFLVASDPDGDPLTFRILNGPSNGVLTGSAPNLRYKANPGFVGTDSFRYRANDGTDESNTATVTLIIGAVNRPQADDQTVSTAPDTPVNITLTGSDPFSNSLTFVIVSGPEHGTLDGVRPNLVYTPDPGFTGSDSFTFLASNGSTSSAVATVSIEVLAFNPPQADDQSVITATDIPVNITLTGSDPGGGGLTFAIVSSPRNGTLDGVPPNVEYLPNPGFAGNDSFTFRVNNGTTNSAAATVSIEVQVVDVAPIADAGQNQNVDCDSPSGGAAVSLDGSGSSTASGVLTYLWTGPFGTATGVAPTVLLPSGQHVVTLVVNNGFADSSPAIVLITVEDSLAPDLICPDLLLMNQTERTGAPASDPMIQTWLASVIATDACDPNPEVFHDAPNFFPLGRTDVIFMATDAAGNSTECLAIAAVLVVIPGDLDADGDVDAADGLALMREFTGPGIPARNPLADLDGDGDVDLTDWLVYQSEFTGSR